MGIETTQKGGWVDIRVNGKREAVEPGTPLLAFLESKAIDPRHVAVEINRDILARDAFCDTTLQAEDTVEILRFVGGG